VTSPAALPLARWRAKRPWSLFAYLEQHERLALCMVFVVAILLRVLFLERVPNTVTADELDFASNTLEVLTGQGPGLFGLDWTPEPALSLYFIVWSWQLFGMTLFAERLVAALLTAAAIVPFYALARRSVAVPVALVATALFAASRWYLLFSRSGWNNGPMVLYMLLAAWSVTRALESRQRRYWVGFGAALALLLYGYFAGRVVILAFVAYLALLLWQRVREGAWSEARELVQGGLLAAAVAVVLFLPELPAILANLATFNRRVSSVYIFSQPLGPDQTPLGVLGSQVWSTVRSFLLMDSSLGTGRYKGPNQGWLDPVSAALYLVGLLLAARRGQRFTLWWCLFLIPLLATQVLSSDTPDGARAIAAVAPMYALVGLALDALWRYARPRVPWAFEGIAVAAVVVALYNLGTYGAWVNSPVSIQARQPGVPVAGFYTWRDFQLSRLNEHLGVMTASAYDQQPAAAIAAQIAGVPVSVVASTNAPQSRPSLPAAPPANPAPRANMAHAVATIGAPGDGPGLLTQPRDVAVDRDGNYYVVDTGRRKVVKYAQDGHFLLEWGTLGTAPGQWQQPWADAVAPDGTIDVLDAQVGQVSRFDAQGDFLGLVAGLGNLVSSRGMSLGLDETFYVAHTPANQLVRVASTGAALPPLESDAQGKRLFDQPTSAVAEADHRLFVYEPDSGKLQLYAADAHLLASLAAPKVNTFDAGRLAITPDGRVLLGDAAQHRVIVFAPDGTLVGYFPVEGAPQGIAVTPAGNVVMVDMPGKVLRVYAFGAG